MVALYVVSPTDARLPSWTVETDPAVDSISSATTPGDGPMSHGIIVLQNCSVCGKGMGQRMYPSEEQFRESPAEVCGSCRRMEVFFARLESRLVELLKPTDGR